MKYDSIRNQLDELMGANRNGDRGDSIISVRVGNDSLGLSGDEETKQ